jgi:DNA-binding NtrC family response regulator
MATHRILIVDDERALRFAIRDFLESSGYAVIEAEDLRAARVAVADEEPDLVLLDYRLPDGESSRLIPDLKAFDPDIPIVVLTGHGTIELAVESVKLGADQFITKPVQLPTLKVIIERLLENRRAKKKAEAHSRSVDRPVNPFEGSSQVVRELRDQAMRVARSDRPILIEGETGSGKGVLARWIHNAGPFADEPFVDLNCAGLTRELVESELFGHEKGAFTGAVATKPGLLEIAAGGTVFLDEIGDMDLALQAKLLKAVEEKRIRRVGDVRDRQVAFRLITATHRDLAAMSHDQTFRSDLYFRINTIRLSMPPLRKRTEDIPVLAESFLRAIARDLGHPQVRLTDAAMQALQRHAWPGNVRELRNVIERAVLLTSATELSTEHLRFDERSTSPRRDPATMTLADCEREHIRLVMELEDGHVERAAARLGIPRSSLYQKLKKLASTS